MSRRILLVDDEPTNLHILRKMLEPLDLEMVEATSGRAALAALEAGVVDLVLLDVRMPDLDGIDVLMHIRARPIWIPVVLVTASTDREDRLRGLAAGADEFLEKPVDRQVLLARVRTLLHHQAATAQLRAQKLELEQTLHRQRELTAFITHDLRNPLTVLHTNIEFATATLSPDQAETLDALGDASDASHRLLGQIESLLAVSTLEAGERRVEPVNASISTLFRVASDLIRREAAQRDVRIEVRATEGLTVRADPVLLRGVLQNLADKAVRHTPARGCIEFAAEEEGEDGMVCLTVSNTGSPVPAGERERVFAKYARLEPSSTRSGRGLGLHYCKLVVEAHGGTIVVRDRPDWPTCFEIRLPGPARNETA